MRIRVGAATDVGRVRQRNEDSYLTADPLFAVADGLGGHQGGDVASRLALEVVSVVASDGGPEDGIPDRLRRKVQEANRTVHQRASEEPDLAGMGTTLTAVVAGRGRLYLAHVGDSRAYLLRDGTLRALTDDHTLVQRLVDEGKLTPEEAAIHPQRSILTRALGIDEEIEVDQAIVEVKPGDRILLCSDGLTSMVEETEVERIVSEDEDPQAASDRLVAAANEAGGQDNITTVVLDVVESEPAPPTHEASAEAPGVRLDGGFTAPPRRRRRFLVMGGIVVLLLATLLVAGRMYLDRQWFVGVNEGRVALFQG